MRKVNILALFITSVTAHSAVNSLTIDGTLYPARLTTVDDDLGVKRIEWKFKDMNNFPFMAVSDVLDPAITCGLSPQPPELKGVARAGANVTVQWTGIIAMHQGPVMTYLGSWSPGMKPQEVKFFKISHAGFDSKRRAWANEDLINQKTADTFQLPSDIKPGLYILRTELLALHGNGMSSSPTLFSGPQFYTHCFNIEIQGNGNVVPPGVTFPGAYKREDPGVKFNLYTNRATWDSYIIPGPPKYDGKYESPIGEKPIVAPKDTGAFPPEFEVRYQAYKQKTITYTETAYTYFNNMFSKSKSTSSNLGDNSKFFQDYLAQQLKLKQEQAALKAEGIKLGLINP